MKVLLLAAIAAFGLLGTDGAKWNLDRMILKAVGKEAASAFGDYGCNCGFRQKGTPVDATDRCCAEHNCCYHRAENVGCKTKKIFYQIDYHWKDVNCSPQDYCPAQVCECDKALAHCFVVHKSSYNKKYQYYSERNCRGVSPKC
ncbi:phospholipase A2, membrane associated-like [Erinaceus europaeus]|uniref:Phospholipase A2 n=1 Tax=Erinaceus europaeus TaxID=9365 RepID=A0ABM3Y787_ERIEU|nr:phospholipase A2, membrane associated-like [Erinaceus europaeus]